MYPIIYRWMTDEPWDQARDPDRLDLLPVWARPLALDRHQPRSRRGRSIRMRIDALTSDIRRKAGAGSHQEAGRPVAGLNGCDGAEPCW